jgi:hypothetical protein
VTDAEKIARNVFKVRLFIDAWEALDPDVAMACLSVISMGLLSSTGPYWTLPSSQFSGAATAGGIAIVTTIGGFGAFASTWIVGVLNTVTGSTATGLWYFSALAFIGPVAMLISTRPSKAVSGRAK